jgi:hypothetical protein
MNDGLPLSPPRACLTCGCDDLIPVNDGELTNFLCPRCAKCWHAELGYIHRVLPETCPGCELFVTFDPACPSTIR